MYNQDSQIHQRTLQKFTSYYYTPTSDQKTQQWWITSGLLMVFTRFQSLFFNSEFSKRSSLFAEVALNAIPEPSILCAAAQNFLFLEHSGKKSI